MPPIIPQSWYVHYTGSNMSDVLDMLNYKASSFEVTWRVQGTDPASGMPMIMRGYEERYPLPPDRYVIRLGNGAFGAIITAEEFEYRYAGTVDQFLSIPISYLGTGVVTYSTAIAIGATASVSVRVYPPIPASKITNTGTVQAPVWSTTAQLRSEILSSAGITLGSVSLVGTPAIITPYVAGVTTNGVLVPEHTVVRTQVRNAGLGVLSSVQIMTFAHI